MTETQQKSCVLFYLPAEIFRLVANTFLRGDETTQNAKVFKFCRDWRNFMNSQKEFLGEWKKENQLISLSSHLSKEFYRSLSSRKQVLGYVKYPEEQLELSIDFRSWEYNLLDLK
jgi:hypothetical protein